MEYLALKRKQGKAEHDKVDQPKTGEGKANSGRVDQGKTWDNQGTLLKAG